jgi:hypothetical protein
MCPTLPASVAATVGEALLHAVAEVGSKPPTG